MERRIDPDQEAARKGPLGPLLSPPPKRQVVFYRHPHRFSQFRDRLSFEGDHIAQIDHLAMEEIAVFIELDFGYINPIFHHGSTPASYKNRRPESTNAL